MPEGVPFEVLVEAVLAGVAASIACGLGVLPLFMRGIDPARHRGLGYAFAGGLMFSASVYNLILPGMQLDGGGWGVGNVLPILAGMGVGALFLALTDRYLHHGEEDFAKAMAAAQNDAEREAIEAKRPRRWKAWGGRVGLLVFIAMTVHSIPEGVAVGTGYTSDAVQQASAATSREMSVGMAKTLGPTLAVAIAIHNIPEGLAVAIPMRSAGAGLLRCFLAAVFTSLPQPIACIPAVLLAWFFQPIMPGLMGFAAGAMIFLVVLELIPEALDEEKPVKIAWAFLAGFGGMLLMQVVL